jgi:hypothetical protein
MTGIVGSIALIVLLMGSFERHSASLAATKHQSTTRSSAQLGPQGWRDAGLAIDGAVDADAVVLPDGRLRMYYGVDEGASATQRISSSVSSDGKTWQREATDLVGKTWGAPDVVRLPDGRFRMYFTPSEDPLGLPPGQQRSVRSAISDDGINWSVEDGFRLVPEAFPQLVPGGGIQYQVTHPGVVQLPDGSWLMLAAFNYEKGFDPDGVSSATQTELIVWATSPDGLTFTARGIAVDSRHKATFDGYASSPDPIVLADGTVRAYFWSPGPQVPHAQECCNGILSTTFTGNGWAKPLPVRTSAPFPEAFAAGDGGSDPTSALFHGRMLLFHGHGGGKHEFLDYSTATSETHRFVVMRPSGAGTITSGMALGASPPRSDGSTGLTCRGARCSTKLFDGTRLWLTAKPRPGHRFLGWKGCNAKRSSGFPRPLPGVRLCWVHVTKNVTVTAHFA